MKSGSLHFGGYEDGSTRTAGPRHEKTLKKVGVDKTTLVG